jgi:hypothetical protein
LLRPLECRKLDPKTQRSNNGKKIVQQGAKKGNFVAKNTERQTRNRKRRRNRRILEKRGIKHGNSVDFFSEYSAYFAVATVPR